MGLSTADGYIACGSESNEVQHKAFFFTLFYSIIKCETIIRLREFLSFFMPRPIFLQKHNRWTIGNMFVLSQVYAYHRSLPMPITSYKFGSIDPISGKETDDDNGLFVSSVCWRRRSDMVVAANSSGCIKVLQMV